MPENKAEPERVLVTTADGVRVPGWAVRRDVVVAQAGGLTLPINVTLDGKPVQAEAVHEALIDLDDVPWTALELPKGTIDVIGERLPPTLPPATDDDTRRGARPKANVAFWCLVFPNMRGCR